MKVLHISTFDKGGAAFSCIRLHLALLNSGIDSKILVKSKKSNIKSIVSFHNQSLITLLIRFFLKVGYKFGFNYHPDFQKHELERCFIFKKEFRSFEYFATPFSDFHLHNNELVKNADVIHLHWVAGFLDYPSFFQNVKKPIIWTLHDMAPFTGGNHFSEFLYSLDLDEHVDRIKLSDRQIKILSDFKILKNDSVAINSIKAIISPSEWLSIESKASSIFSDIPHFIIPYGIDSKIFNFTDKEQARNKLGLPLDKKIFLFVADSISNTRKGFFILEKVIDRFQFNDILIVAIGKKHHKLPSGVFFGGEIADQSMISLFYSAADAFILPSLEDNLPNTLLESLMCGTPVLGFSVGGLKETIINGFNGFISEDISVTGLFNLIQKFIKCSDDFNSQLIRNDSISKFDSNIQANLYVDIYNKVLNVS